MSTLLRDKRTGRAESILFEVASELRALAYLFGTQGQVANEICELDMDQISHGIGRMLSRQTDRIQRARGLLEPPEPAIRRGLAK